jgi:dienelactone hydrolase
MRKRWCTALALLCLLPVWSVAAPPTAEVFGALPQSHDVIVSPDGSSLAWGEVKADVQTVNIFDIDARKIIRSERIDPSMSLRSLFWSDSSTLLLQMSYRNDRARRDVEFFRFAALDVKSGALNVLLMKTGDLDRVTGAHLLALHAGKPNTVIMSTLNFSASSKRKEIGTRLNDRQRDSGWRLSVFAVDTHTGDGTLLEEGSPFTAAWVVDATGRVVARTEWNSDGQVFRLLAKNGSGWQEIYHQEHHENQVPAGLVPDGSAVLLSDATEQGFRKLLAVPLDGSAPRVFLEEPGRDVESVYTDPFTLQPIAARLGGLEPATRWFKSEDEQRFMSLQRAFPGKQLDPPIRSENGERLVVRVYSPSLPVTYYLVDMKTHRADIVAEQYPELANVALGTVKTLTYKARDGTDIPAYLTLPPASAAKNLPLVVLPHAGPEARNAFTFDWLAQFLATRGYAVLQAQFRGSSGFGNAFRLAGRRQWGGLMQDDVSDGVSALIQQGVADPTRVAIVGSNYGGYAALAGAAFTPQLYACAVSVNGISNLPEILQIWEGAHAEPKGLGYWRESIGSRLDPEVSARSPIQGAAAVRAAVLLIYSADEPGVPPEQSENMARALRAAGKEVKEVRLVGDDEWVARSDTRIQTLKETEQFLAAHLH